MEEAFPITASNHLMVNDVRRTFSLLPVERHLSLDTDIHKALSKAKTEYRDALMRQE